MCKSVRSVVMAKAQLGEGGKQNHSFPFQECLEGVDMKVEVGAQRSLSSSSFSEVVESVLVVLYCEKD